MSTEQSTKLCRGCDRVLPLSSFHRKTGDKCQTRCKDCVREYGLEYNRKTKDRQREYDKQYVEKNRARISARRREYHERNRDRINANTAEWRKANPGRIREYTSKQYAQKHGHDSFIPDEQFKAMCEFYGNHCLCCGATGVTLARDHVIPLSKGGANIIENIQPLCIPCNGRKADGTTDYREEPFAVRE